MPVPLRFYVVSLILKRSLIYLGNIIYWQIRKSQEDDRQRGIHTSVLTSQACSLPFPLYFCSLSIFDANTVFALASVKNKIGQLRLLFPSLLIV